MRKGRQKQKRKGVRQRKPESQGDVCQRLQTETLGNRKEGNESDNVGLSLTVSPVNDYLHFSDGYHHKLNMFWLYT